MSQLNVLPLIKRWLDTFPAHDCMGEKREALRTWVEQQKDLVTSSDVELALDCLCAVGIGDEDHQHGTVYGGYSYY